MNRLPLPNWNCTPNINPTGNFSAILNVGYGGLPFTGQHYRSLPPHMFVPRPPVHTNVQESRSQAQMPQSQALPSKPEDFSCDVCERSFKTKHILDAHLKSHVKCDHEGCSFFASRKMLKLHFIQNHAKGRMRIKLDTPEEIEKWREQRRKRYPTFANIQKKLAEEKARRENGQIAETQTFRYQGKKQRNNRRFNRHKQSKYQNQARHETQFNNSNNANQHDVKKEETKEPVGDPLSLLLDNSNVESDSEEKQAQNTNIQPSASASTSALASLCSYGGDSSSDESDTEKEVNNNNQVINPIQSITSDQKLPNNTEIHSPNKRVSRKRKQELGKNKRSKSKKVTLLEKLLAPEIRHESNVILQCIRYIVKNNYFDAE